MRQIKFWAAVGLVLLLLLAALLRLGSLGFDYDHPDEVISVKVAEKVVATGSLDTNWRNAELPREFKLPQYNFSAYVLSSAAVLQAKEWWPGAEYSSSLTWLRIWSAWLGVAVVALTFFVGRLFFGAATGGCAALLVCFFPLLYQDSLYARPETFVTVLTLAAAGLAASPRPLFRGAFAVAAFLVGVLIATKISLILLLPLLVLALNPPKPQPDPASSEPPAHRGSWEQLWNRGKWLPVAVGLGFFAGAPHAFANIGDYVEGIVFLRRQYTTGHWPHELVDTDFLGRLNHTGRYFRATAGWLMLLAFAGASVATLRRHFRPLMAFMFAWATVLQFAVYPTFFERNLSHVVPLFMIFAAFGLVSLCGAAVRAPVPRAALTGAALLVVMLPSLRTTLTLRFDELPRNPDKHFAAMRASLESRLGVPSARPYWTPYSSEVRQAMAYRCDGPMLVELKFPGDLRSQRLLEELVEHDGLREAGRHYSNFAAVPASTLHTYFRPTTVFLHRPPGLANCFAHRGGFVAARAAGELLPVISAEPGPGWRLAGTPDIPKDSHGSPHFYGSWAGSDASVGRVRLVASVEGARYFVLPFLTGPKTRRQSIRVSDAVTGAPIFDSVPPHVAGWQFAMIRVPRGTSSVLIEGVDYGNDWGEWHALGMPRTLKTH